MKRDAGSKRRSPRERFTGAEHVFNLRGIAAALRDESTPSGMGIDRSGIYHKAPVTFVVFDLDAGARLTDHQPDAHVTILTLSGLLEVSTSEQHQVPSPARWSFLGTATPSKRVTLLAAEGRLGQDVPRSASPDIPGPARWP